MVPRPGAPSPDPCETQPHFLGARGDQGVVLAMSRMSSAGAARSTVNQTTITTRGDDEGVRP
jgi:hypothetical protein